ncbi:MAG TPA: DUF305 domain-containing protein [Thermomicrobiales bacterium]|nr:DUF305 domain-containing protein [Thermomicrobiales bacterium]
MTSADAPDEQRSAPWAPIVAVALVVALLAGIAGRLIGRATHPANDSVEAGFARDMAAHHIQAVEMALIARDGTASEDIRFLATDIILTQQGQIGIMRGWLDAWGLPPNSSDAPMAWAGGRHDVGEHGMMPGMLTRDQITALNDLDGVALDREFLTPMIEHHEGGVVMAEAALESLDGGPVHRLAQSIVDAQQAEIDLMDDMLTQLGAE